MMLEGERRAVATRDEVHGIPPVGIRQVAGLQYRMAVGADSVRERLRDGDDLGHFASPPLVSICALKISTRSEGVAFDDESKSSESL